MRISKRSPFTGKVNEMEIPINPERWASYEARRAAGTARLIQDEFPDLSVDHREFLLTGITPEEWEETFGKEK